MVSFLQGFCRTRVHSLLKFNAQDLSLKSLTLAIFSTLKLPLSSRKRACHILTNNFIFPGKINEPGCTRDHMCQGGALCIDGTCRCPTGYKSVSQDTKCAKNGGKYQHSQSVCGYVWSSIVPGLCYIRLCPHNLDVSLRNFHNVMFMIKTHKSLDEPSLDECYCYTNSRCVD